MSRILTALKRLQEKEPAAASGAANMPFVAAAPPSVALVENAPPLPPPVVTAWPSGQPAACDASAAPATIPLPGMTEGATAPAYGRRASDRYVVAPEYAALCGRILARVAVNRPAALLILPADDSADASTVVAELALSLAQIADERVLALDADVLGSDAAGAAIEVEGATGLCDVLTGKVQWQAALSPTRDRRVQLLAVGKPAGEGFSGGAFRLAPLLAEMKTRYRFLVVHGGDRPGPLDGPLTKSCELAYLVIHQGHTSQRAARKVKRRIERLGGALHGCILAVE